MEDSYFWQYLAVEFHRLDPYGFDPVRALRAEWFYSVTQLPGDPPQSHAVWIVKEGIETETSLCLRFDALARRGGAKIADPEDPHDSLTIWLDAVREETIHQSGMGGGKPEWAIDGVSPGVHLTYEMLRVCDASADLCTMLESRAVEAERFARSRPREEPPIEKQRPRQQPQARAETVAEQLAALRKECRWTIEQLAEKTGLGLRSVQRHLSGATPYDRNITSYERVFSKQLKRQVVIKKMA